MRTLSQQHVPEYFEAFEVLDELAAFLFNHLTAVA